MFSEDDVQLSDSFSSNLNDGLATTSNFSVDIIKNDDYNPDTTEENEFGESSSTVRSDTRNCIPTVPAPLNATFFK